MSVAGLFYGSDTVVSHEKAATAGVRCRQHVCCCSDGMMDALVWTAVVLHNGRPTDLTPNPYVAIRDVFPDYLILSEIPDISLKSI